VSWYSTEEAPTSAAPAVISTMPSQWCTNSWRRRMSTVNAPANSTSVPRSIWYVDA
jgi:hypothetical protein